MWDGVRIGRGVYADYRLLERYHYRAGRPAVPVRVLRARVGREVAGVLVVARPTLNGRWRRAGWGKVIRGDRRARAAWLNAEVRTIARVIVDPRFRGMSIARRLVRAYLRDPETGRTEAVAAMGAYCPFFERAGMREVRCGPNDADRRLARVLRAARVRPWELVDLSRARRILSRSRRVREGVRAWARSREGLRGRGLGVGVAVLAGQALVAPVRAYVHP